MSSSGSTKVVLKALIANLGIATSKFVAFLVTGSSSLLAESVHSVADSGNQALLLVGGKRAQREATAAHPFGYGRERYIYAFIVSIVLFSVGGLFAIYEGQHKIALVLDGEGELTSPFWAFGVLGVAIALESFALRAAVIESNKVKGSQSWVQFVRRARSPELPVVLLEDCGALLGLVFALAGLTAAVLTGNVIYDGVGTLAIGVLLVVIAVILAIETKSLLLGESATKEDVAEIKAALAGTPGVGGIIHMKTLHLGPDELLVAAKIAVERADTAADVAVAINTAETRIREAVPIARVIYLEPDIDRADRNGAASGTAPDATQAAADSDAASTPGR